MSNFERKTRLNTEIKGPKVRLIGADGSQVGIVSIHEALRSAQEAEMDLVEISPNADPPVCRVMNFGKFVFQQNKQKAVARKKQHQVQIKELKFRPTIEEGDYQVKLRNLIRFLKEGDKVKITLRFRGREVTHQELGMKILQRLQGELSEHGIVEQTPKMEGKQLVMLIGPKKAS